MNALLVVIFLSVPLPEPTGQLFHEHCKQVVENYYLCEVVPANEECEHESL